MALQTETLKDDMAQRIKLYIRQQEDAMGEDVTPDERNDRMLDAFCKAISGSVVDHFLGYAVIEIANDVHDHECDCKVHKITSSGNISHTLSRGRDVDDYTHSHGAELK